MGVAWMDGGGARQAPAASGELRAGIDCSGGGGGVAYEARGYKQGWADERAGRRASRRPKLSQKRDFGSWVLLFLVVGVGYQAYWLLHGFQFECKWHFDETWAFWRSVV